MSNTIKVLDILTSDVREIVSEKDIDNLREDYVEDALFSLKIEDPQLIQYRYLEEDSITIDEVGAVLELINYKMDPVKKGNLIDKYTGEGLYALDILIKFKEDTYE